MPSTRPAKQAIKRLLPEKIEGTVYELGSGWGGLLKILQDKYPSNKVIGYELSLFPWIVSFLRTRVAFRKDFFKADLTDAGLIVCYLYPKQMRKLYEKFKKEVKPGTLVVSNTFSIPGLTPLKVETLDDLYQTKIYLYQL